MKINQAVPYIQVSNLAASLDFHTEVLGYQVREELRFDNGDVFWASLSNGPSSLMLSSLPVHDRSRLTWLYVDDADEAYKGCVASGYRPLTKPKDEEHGCREFLAVDDGGEVYVIAHLLQR